MFLFGAVLCFFSKNEGKKKRLNEMEQRRTDVFPPPLYSTSQQQQQQQRQQFEVETQRSMHTKSICNSLVGFVLFCAMAWPQALTDSDLFEQLPAGVQNDIIFSPLTSSSSFRRSKICCAAKLHGLYLPSNFQFLCKWINLATPSSTLERTNFWGIHSTWGRWSWKY